MELANTNKFSNAEGGFAAMSLKNLPTFYHKYIDGTNQMGRYINENGKIFKVVKNGVPEYYDYPKDKGFVERDGNGNYFYFEPLPDFKIQEIKRLEKLRDDTTALAIEAKRVAEVKKRALEKVQADAKRKFELAKEKTDSAEKTEVPVVVVTEKKLLGMPKKIGVVVIVVGVIALAFGGYKYFKK